ncbi:ABC transporter substrate-binding protein [Euzebya tangerina]|uniref:ABC transporter substrate-binding protein n=1 Tax=Euzebya tangerina TaxID=591198 RepID=UPI0013C368CE|nr:extracellular solute-binding protein [Euzebya tangerina]
MTTIDRRAHVAVALILVLIAAACGGGDTAEGGDTGSEAATSDDAADAAAGAAEEDTESDEANDEAMSEEIDDDEATEDATGGEDSSSGDRVEIRWFVGLGSGGQPEQIAAQEEVVAEFNDSQSEIEVVLEIVENDVAYDTLSTQIAGGNAPDIVGPVGRDGSNSYAGLYLDLEPFVEETGVDLTRFDEETVENFREEDGTLPGLPFASFPSFIYYNTELFDEAGLPYPPQEYGEDGTAIYGEGTEFEGTWDWDKVAELAAFLTVDANGVDATDDAFDRTQTVQWGFVHQWVSLMYAQGTAFGAGYPVADDGSADIPDQWVDEWQWYHDLVWDVGAAPSQEQFDSDLLSGNPFSSGNVAMANSHLWYTCCVRDEDGNGLEFFDIAVFPSHQGTVTAKMHGDTFRIFESTEHPDEAFEVLTYLLDDAALPLLNAYGAAPADPALTEAFYADLDETFPQGVNWQVARDSAQFSDVPSHEQATPAWDEYKLAMADFESAQLSDPDLDIAAAAGELEAELDGIFAAAE